MNSPSFKIYPPHSDQTHPDPVVFPKWEAAIIHVLDAVRAPIREHPLKVVILATWTGLFVGLLIRG